MRLNLGCGRDIRRGWVNLDRQPFPGVDVAHDLDVLPWPFEATAFERIDALDVFEHVADLVAVMDECWRVLAPGGALVIRGPLANGAHHWIDPTHRRAFVPGSFDYFCANTRRGQRYGYGAGRWHRRQVLTANDNVIFELERCK